MVSVDPTENDASSYANLASFYEKYPYPTPVEDLSGYIAVWSSTARRRSEYHLLFPDQAFREDLDILVAGCGTSQAARHAVRWPSASVLGIDVSEATLRHTDELKRRHGLSNLETLKLAIEDVGQLDREFDLIICTAPDRIKGV
jgi:2-polyprenyl-3-methyl-5-hydroxy-6-metoxy-1,4-benzoquinol methylase